MPQLPFLTFTRSRKNQEANTPGRRPHIQSQSPILVISTASLTCFHQVKELFEMYDSDADNNLSLNELCQLLQDIGNKITALPAVRMSYSLASLLQLRAACCSIRRPKLLLNKGSTSARNYTSSHGEAVTCHLINSPMLAMRTSMVHSNICIWAVWRTLAMQPSSILAITHSWAVLLLCMRGEACTGMNRCQPEQGLCS